VLRCVQWAVNLAALAVLLIVFTPLGHRLAEALSRTDELAEADYIVVLGGDLQRVVEGAKLYREGWAGKLVISSLPADMDPYARLAEDFGVPAADIVRDSGPRRTADHPRTVAERTGADRASARLIVVTSRLHTARAGACFEHAGYAHVILHPPRWQVPAASDFRWGNWVPRAHALPACVYEAAAWACYRARRWL
jgi:uncharacterized SAM-binding protein YcdF (DUF218 family)